MCPKVNATVHCVCQYPPIVTELGKLAKDCMTTYSSMWILRKIMGVCLLHTAATNCMNIMIQYIVLHAVS